MAALESSTHSAETQDSTTSDMDGSPHNANNSMTLSAMHCSKDQIDGTAKPGQCGIYNLGNTCFMNAGLHCLMNTAPIVKYFLDHYSCDAKFGPSLAAQFYGLACKYWSGRYSIIHPGDFKTTLGTFHGQFEDYRQHDCQEFLALMLDTLHEEMNKSNVITMGHRESLPSTDNPKMVQEQLNNSLDQIVVPTSEVISTQNSNDLLNNSYEHTPQSTPEPNATEQLNNSIDVKKGTDTELMMQGGDVVSGERTPVSDQSGSHVDCITSSRNDASVSSQQIDADDISPLRPLLNNSTEFKQTLPSLHQFYAKESKTLNTNVLLDKENGGESLNTDSHKFAKQDNDSPLRLNEVNLLQDIAPMEIDKNDHPKGLKDINIQADKCKKASIDMALCFPDDTCKAKSTTVNADVGSKCFDPDVDGVKRMKFETTEKNFQHQAFSKLNRCMTDSETTCSTVLQDFKNTRDLIADSPKSTDTETKVVDEVETNSIVGLSESVGAQQLDEEEEEDEEEDDDDEEEVLCDAADQAWDSYIKLHNSIVVSTFQGMFKSTVICSDCSHVSVTFEPFMYLSVPLPHSMERQICVWFMPTIGSPTKYLLTLHKNDKVHNIKQQLKEISGATEQDLVLAEVLEGHIAKTLEDNIALRFVNDSTRLIFAYQMPPPPECANQLDVSNNQMDVFSNMDTFVPGVTQLDDKSISQTVTYSKPGTESCSGVEGNENGVATPVMTAQGEKGKETDQYDGVTLEMVLEDSDRQGLEMPRTDLSLMDDDPYNLKSDLQTDTSVTDTSTWGDQSLLGQTSTENWNYESNQMNQDRQETFPSSANTESIETWMSESIPLKEAPPVVTPDEWKSCAICLEDLMDIELMVHQQCGGTFCQTCLERSVHHYGEESYTCPVCSAPAVLTEDFISLGAGNSDQPVKVRVISVPLSFNICTATGDRRLIGYPRPVYLANTMTGQQLYDFIDGVCPVSVSYTLALTDGQGLHCSRCDFTSKCQGCLLTREDDVVFRPGDNLAVCFGDMNQEEMTQIEAYNTDKSMELLRPDKPLHVNDCVQAFAESEVLDEHNPWFCPRCERNQCAKKTMTVWQYPDRLIIHLKRFMFHELSSTKVDNSVVFPLEGLDLTQMISGPNTKCPLYDLYGIVCHFGGANAGHYTAYARHPQDHTWYYYNDETITQQEPHCNDFSNAYILFYQRQGTEVKFDCQEFLTRHKIEGLCVPAAEPDCSFIGPLPQGCHGNGPKNSQGSCDPEQAGDIAIAS